MARTGGLVGRVVEAVERRAGFTVQAVDRVQQLVEVANDHRLLRRQHEDLGWASYRYAAGQPQDLEPRKRRDMAAKGRLVWLSDAQYGHAIKLRNAFCFGRGVGKPNAADEQVQEALDEFWEDHDNLKTLTSPQAQFGKGTSLWLNSNVFVAVFDDGMDGKVKLGTIKHDTIAEAIPDKERFDRVLYYHGSEAELDWDYQQHQWRATGTARPVYWPSLDGLDDLKAEGRQPPQVEAQYLKPGRVIHVAINKTDEMIFGVPESKRMIRWAAAYNDLLSAQVDKARAAARWLMKVNVTGSQTQLVNQALNAIGRRSPLGVADPGGEGGRAERVPLRGDGGQVTQVPGGGPAGVLYENESAKAESFKLDTGGAQAASDLDQARSAFAAGSGFPGHYYGGDPGSLAGATTVELPVLKLVEMDQEVWEGTFRRAIDRVIERKRETGFLSDRREPTEDELRENVELGPDGLVERDFSYEFTMPNALRRMMVDTVQAVSEVAKTFDPTNSRPELSRVLLALVLAEAFDVQNAPKLVERVFPKHEDLQAAADAGKRGGAGGVDPNAGGTGGRGPQGEKNPYSARQRSQNPEDVRQPLTEAEEAALGTVDVLADELVRIARTRARDADGEFDELIGDPVLNGGGGG